MEEKSTDDHKENDKDNPKQVVGEIRTITRGLVVGVIQVFEKSSPKAS